MYVAKSIVAYILSSYEESFQRMSTTPPCGKGLEKVSVEG
jgi:hypothetical protein